MYKEILDILCCPKCKGELELKEETISNGEILSGKLVCKSCKTEYKIEEGIPIMLVE